MPGYETCLFLYKAVNCETESIHSVVEQAFFTCALIIISAPLTLNSGSGKLLNITSLQCELCCQRVFPQCFCFPSVFSCPCMAGPQREFFLCSYPSFSRKILLACYFALGSSWGHSMFSVDLVHCRSQAGAVYLSFRKEASQYLWPSLQ